uniref:Uncharacterized protein n=1 Tax=Caenorhabditis japonica TaxID=281687 RepID=A0A8R1II24_CAEJA
MRIFILILFFFVSFTSARVHCKKGPCKDIGPFRERFASSTIKKETEMICVCRPKGPADNQSGDSSEGN